MLEDVQRRLKARFTGIANDRRGLGYARLAWREAERSADAASALQRPWIRVEIVPTGKVEVGSFGHIQVPMEMSLINEGGTPALRVSHGEHGFTHLHDDADYEKHWLLAASRASEQSRSNPGLAIFPHQKIAVDVTQILGPDRMETEDGQFTFSFGVVVSYRGGKDHVG